MKAIDKAKFKSLLIEELKNSVASSHIYYVVNVILDELVDELKNDLPIKVINFGTFKLVPRKSHKAMNVGTKEIFYTRPSNMLIFKLSRRLSRYILKKQK